jgi:acetyl-CoA acetyltransferase
MAWMAPYGVQSPAQKYAFKVQRYMHEHGVRQEALRAVAMASGSDHRTFANPVNAPRYASASFVGVAEDLFRMARLGPADMGSVQAYENFTGGNLAEGYIHGMELVLEAVRQLRGSSTAQAARRDAALVIGGPLISPVSSLILGSEATL